jgi:hypothetical protein
MMNKAKFLEYLHHWDPKAHPHTDLPVELESMEDFSEVLKILSKLESFSMWDFRDCDAIRNLRAFSDWKSPAYTDFFQEYLPADLARIMLGTFDRYSFEISGDMVPRFVNEIEMISTQLRDIDTAGKDEFHVNHLAGMANEFRIAAKEMYAGIVDGYGDVIIVTCG